MMYDFCTILAYLFVSMCITPAKGNFSRLVSTSVHFRSVSPYHLECQLPVVGDNPSSIFNINEYSRLWMMFNYMYFTSRLPFFRVTFIQQTLCHCYLLYHPTFLRIYWPSLVNSWKLRWAVLVSIPSFGNNPDVAILGDNNFPTGCSLQT